MEWESPYTDDLSIPDEEIVYRRIKIDDASVDRRVINSGRPRIKGGAFQDVTKPEQLEKWNCPEPAMSVFLASVLESHDDEPESLVRPGGGIGLVRTTAGAIRAADQGIQRDPLAGEPSHAIVFAKLRRKKNRKEQSDLAHSAEWVLFPEDS